MSSKSASSMVQIAGADHLETLRRCGGFYRCPKDGEGRRLGPLVGYTGKYDSADGPKQWVGDTYANFAKAEPFPHVLRHFAEQMAPGIAAVIDSIDVFCGAPLGGYSFAEALGRAFDRRVIKAEKKVLTLATTNAREQSTVVFGRHEVGPEDIVAVAEDVCNNFSTTGQLIELISKCGGQVTAIVCLLNRSLTIGSHYTPASSSAALPVISLIRLPIPEYRQDDPEVSGDVARGHVIWKPKDKWQTLVDAMEAAKALTSP